MSSFYQVEHLTSKSMEKVVSLQPFDRNRTSSTCVHNFDVTISLLSLVFIVFGNKKKTFFVVVQITNTHTYLAKMTPAALRRVHNTVFENVFCWV
jgi:fido (protein-threonine AMPylation protein)